MAETVKPQYLINVNLDSNINKLSFLFQAVYDWYLDVFDQHRKALALRGYTDLREATKVRFRFTQNFIRPILSSTI